MFCAHTGRSLEGGAGLRDGGANRNLFHVGADDIQASPACMSPERGDSAGINVSVEHGGIDRVGDG